MILCMNILGECWLGSEGGAMKESKSGGRKSAEVLVYEVMTRGNRG